MARWVITDIHGCNKTFVGLIDHLELEEQDTLYLLGDYIDRGPDSKGVLDIITTLQHNGVDIRCLRGNHEQMMLSACKGELPEANWLMNGGHATLDSFGVERLDEVPESYMDMMEQMGYYFELDDYLLVHAGFNTDAPDPFADTHSMLWIRGHDFEPEKVGNKPVVHGHTPIPFTAVKAMVQRPDSPLINLDNGCVYKGQRDGMGRLCAFELNERRLVTLENLDFA